ncbi:hypothetical protein [Pseudidiomarina aestuarii]|nr:hypothetical protein [Pseudidiomarina aestuarii]
MFKTPPGFISSQLKGLTWPYQLFASEAHAEASPQEYSQSERDELYNEVSSEIAKGNLQMASKIDALAIRLIENESNNFGKKIDPYTKMLDGYIDEKNKVIIFNYLILGGNKLEVIKLQRELFVELMTKQLCGDPELMESIIVRTLIAGGYSFLLEYSQDSDSSPISILITECSN